jgi:hypothetical protein
MKIKISQKLPIVSHSQAYEGVLHSSTGSGATVGYQNTQGTHQRVKIQHSTCVIKMAHHKGPKKAVTACQPLKA